MMDDVLPGDTYRSALADALAQRTPETCQWFIQGEVFQTWILSEDPDALWVFAIPGAGKTVLASATIEYLQHEHAIPDSTVCTGADTCCGVSVLYAFFHRQPNPDTAGVLASMLKQQLEQHPHLESLKAIQDYFTLHRRLRSQPSQRELVDLLRATSRHFKRVYYFIDGLDNILANHIKSELISTIDRALNGKLMITSRSLDAFHDDVRSPRILEITAGDINDDIALFFANEIAKHSTLRAILTPDTVKQQVIAHLCENADGMFLEAALQMKEFRGARNFKDLYNRIERIPLGLGHMYGEIVDRIDAQPPEQADLTKVALLWLSYSPERIELTIDDLRHALAVSPETRIYDADQVIPEDLLTTMCCGLLKIGKESPRCVELAHDTAKDFLLLPGLLWPEVYLKPSPDISLLVASIGRLTSCGLPVSSHTTPAELYQQFANNPFLECAYDNWDDLAENVGFAAQRGDMVFDFIRSFRSWPFVFGAVGGYPEHQRELNVFGPLHMSVYYDFPDVIAALLQDNEYAHMVNEQSPLWRASPLITAADANSPHLARLLAAAPGIQPNLRDRHGDTALTIAASSATDPGALVQALLTAPGIDVNLADYDGSTPLMLAALDGWEWAAEHLLAHPTIQVNATDNTGRTALMYAASAHQVELTDPLPEHAGAAVRRVDKDGVPIPIAVIEQVEELVREFPGAILANRSRVKLWIITRPNGQPRRRRCNTVIRCGWAAESTVSEGATAATVDSDEEWDDAVEHGQCEVVSQLLAAPGINVNLQGDDGHTALMLAARDGRLRVVQQLLGVPGIDVHAQNNRGMSALQLATARARWPIVRELTVTSCVRHEI